MSKDTGKVMIHGKEYETVASRVGKFRQLYPPAEHWSITTEIIERDESMVVMKASIRHGLIVIAEGHAEERRDASTINKTSALENCETSAIGRALAAFGLAGTEFASADEVAQAISQQGKTTHAVDYGYDQSQSQATDKQRDLISKKLAEQGVSVEESSGYLIEQYGVEIPLTKEGASFVISELLSQDKPDSYDPDEERARDMMDDDIGDK